MKQEEINQLNGVCTHPIFQAFNPVDKPFMVARHLKRPLNTFGARGIEMAAVCPWMYPHLKTVPTFGMMFEDFKKGVYQGKHTLVIPSSGNTAHAGILLAPAFGFRHVTIVMPSDAPTSKKEVVSAFAWARRIEPEAGRTTTDLAREEAQKEGHYLLDQYAHPGNMRAHEEYTGPEVHRVLGTDVAVIAVALGSGGTAGGIGSYFHKLGARRPIIVGVRPKLGEDVPGARDKARMEAVVTLPWEQYVDTVVEVSRAESFLGMRQLWSQVNPQPGATGGMALKGLEMYLNSLLLEEIKAFRGKTVGFVCHDDGRFYPERTTGELRPEQGVL